MNGMISAMEYIEEDRKDLFTTENTILVFSIQNV
jgi:hypothetical protein